MSLAALAHVSFLGTDWLQCLMEGRIVEILLSVITQSVHIKEQVIINKFSNLCFNEQLIYNSKLHINP